MGNAGVISWLLRRQKICSWRELTTFLNLPGAKQRIQMFSYGLVRILFYHPIIWVVFFYRTPKSCWACKWMSTLWGGLSWPRMYESIFIWGHSNWGKAFVAADFCSEVTAFKAQMVLCDWVLSLRNWISLLCFHNFKETWFSSIAGDQGVTVCKCFQHLCRKCLHLWWLKGIRMWEKTLLQGMSWCSH